jgi:hypothetical protein
MTSLEKLISAWDKTLAASAEYLAALKEVTEENRAKDQRIKELESDAGYCKYRKECGNCKKSVSPDNQPGI